MSRGLPEGALSQAEERRRRGDIAGAVHELQRAIGELAGETDRGEGEKERRLRARLELLLGVLYEEELGRLDGALLRYQRAYKLDPTELSPLSRGRAIYRALGDVAMVSRLFELELAGAAERDPREALALALAYARLKLTQQRDPSGAAQVLRTALAQQPEDQVLPKDVLETLAEALLSPDYPAEAGEAAEEEEERKSQASELYLALALRQKGTTDEGPRGSGAESSDGNDVAPSPTPTPPALIDSEALRYLRRALGANPKSTAAAAALERLYEQLSSPEREDELGRLYRTLARVPRRALKLLAVYEKQAGEGGLKAEERREVISALRAGLEEADSLDDWHETRGALRRLLEAEGDLAGLGDLCREDGAEAALPEERAQLLLMAADLYRRAGDAPRYLASLEELLAEEPLHAEAFKRVCEYHSGRRDLAGLARAHEARLAALLSAEEIAESAHLQTLEELADLYEKKLGDLAAAADAWRRIDEIQHTSRSQGERRRLGQRLGRAQLQVSELQLELDRAPAGAAGTRTELLRRLAQHHREQHEPARAAELYEELLAFLPSDVPAIKALCDLREILGDVPGQVDALRRLAQVASGRAERLGLLRRLVTLSAGRVDSAEALSWACRALLKELPSDREALRRLGEAQQQVGDARGQLETLEALLKVAPTPQEKLPLHRQVARLAEEGADLERAASHLERAVRLCPPGPEIEALLVELSRVYGAAGRLKEQLQALELAAKNARASAETFRQLGRTTQVEPRDRALEERSLRAWAEVLRRHPNDLEALEATAKLHRARGEWRDLAAGLARTLEIPDQLPEKRLALGQQLADVLSQRLEDRPGAVAILEKVQSESPLCDRQLHHRLRVLHEDLGHFAEAARYAERELLLTEDPLGRMELGMQIASLWRLRARDPGRALLGYERIAELLPPVGEGTVLAREGRRLIAQALDAQSDLHAEASRWDDLVRILEPRVQLAGGEPMRAACILLEVAAVCEEKQGDARRGFSLRRRAYELAPEMVTLQHLSETAAQSSLWAELCEVHKGRIARAKEAGQPPPLDALLSAAQLLSERLSDTPGAFQLLRAALPKGAEGATQVATPDDDAHALLVELLRLGAALSRGGDGAANALGRELLAALHGMVDDLCGRRGAATEEMAVSLHRLLGSSARLREEVLGDARGALDERLRAFQLGGERDRGTSEAANAVFLETLSEVRRLALATSQVKEALAIDTRRLERAEGDERKREVAADAAAWLDDHGADPPRALRACLKALGLCEEGSELQAGLRARLFALGKRLGTLAWEELARAERNVPAADLRLQQRRLLHVARLWEEGAGEILRAIEAAGQAYRATFGAGAGAEAGLREELAAQRPELRRELERLAQKAPSDSEGMARVVTLLDSIASQLTDSGEGRLAAEVLLDAARCDEKRGRLAHAERRYQEVLRGDPASDEALGQLERLYRQGRRWNDLVGLLERRRSGHKERLPKGPARCKMFVELGELYQQLGKSFEALDVFSSMAAEDDADPEPHHRMARIHEGQRAFARAAEALQKEAERCGGEPARALHAFLRCGELWEKNVGSPDRALVAYQAALLQTIPVPAAPDEATEAAELAAAQMAVAADVQLALSGAERVLERLGRPAELEPILARRLEDLQGPDTTEERVLLLRRRLRLLRGLLLREEGAKDRALACAEALAEALPDDDDALRLLGQLYGEANATDRARDLALRRAEAAQRRADPAQVQAALWAQVARLSLADGDVAAAEAQLDRARALHPDDLDSLATIAELRRHHGDLRGQVEALKELAGRTTDPRQAALSLLAAAEVLLTSLGEPKEARVLLERLLARLPEADIRAETARSAVSLLADLTLAAADDAAAEGYARRELGLIDAAEEPVRAAELRTRLGRLYAERGETEEAETQLRAALAIRPGLLPAVWELVGLLNQDVRDDAQTESEALLSQALGEAPEPLDGPARAALLRRLAEAQLGQGKDAEGLVSLKAAEELVPGSMQEQITLGETAFQLGEHEVAARALSNLRGVAEGSAEIKDLPPGLLADALTHGAQALSHLGEAAQSRQLLQDALRLVPGHEDAEDAYSQLLLVEGAPNDDLEQALALLQLQSRRRAAAGDRIGAAGRAQKAAMLVLERLSDRRRAEQILENAAKELMSDDGDPALAAELTEALLSLAEGAGDLEAARRSAAALVELSVDPAERARRRQRLADLCLKVGDEAEAKAQLRQAILDAPAELAPLLRLASLLPDTDAEVLLDEQLRRLPAAPVPERAEAYALLGALRGRQGEGAAAATAYEQALAALGGAEKDREMRLHREAIVAIGLADPAALRRHIDALRTDDPLHEELLARLADLETHLGHRGPARRVLEVLALRRGQDSADLSSLPPIAAGVSLEDGDQALLGDGAARAMADVMATLWEGVAAPKAPGADALGLVAADRLPPAESSPDAVVRAFALCCRVLGNRKALLYKGLKIAALPPSLIAHPPTAVVVGPALWSLPPAQVLFLLGRAVELLRPEYILAESLPREEVARLLGLAVHAFHPRHVRHASEAVAAWRRELPYRAVKRLSDLLRELADLEFSTAVWRRAVRRAGNRAGLVLCGDLLSAKAALCALGGDDLAADLQDLSLFWLSSAGSELADRLRPY